MKIIQEFKKFAIKGNVIDLATAVIIGGAFGKIVSSLVADIVMPLVGLMTGGTDFSGWKIILRPAIADKAALSLNAGIFIQNIVDFLIISVSVFLMIKVLLQIKNKFKKEEDAEKEKVAPEPSAEVKLLTEIRDAIVNKKE